MSLTIEEFVQQLDELAQNADAKFSSAADPSQLDEARVEFLGAKKGKLKSLQKNMSAVANENKKEAGQKLNAVKSAIQTAFETATARLVGGEGDDERDPKIDPTLPGRNFRVGRLHPITQTINELKDIMGRLGFTPAEGPEVEDLSLIHI